MSSTSLKAVSLATQQISPYIVGWLDFGHLCIIQYSVQTVHERTKSKKSLFDNYKICLYS